MEGAPDRRLSTARPVSGRRKCKSKIGPSSQPTHGPANSCRFKEQIRGSAGLLGCWEVGAEQVMGPVPGLAASPFASGPGRRDRKQAAVFRELCRSLDCRLKCATNPGPRPGGRRMEARQQGGDLPLWGTHSEDKIMGSDGTGQVSCLVLLDG